MKEISWSHFNGTQFQEFCNAFLLLEVSRHAQVYSAAGKDNGIDQFFNGTFEGKTGVWRFQDKFHNCGNPTQDFQELKRDLVTDIRTNFSDEDHIVFLTNINLRPPQEKDLHRIAQKELTQKTPKSIEIHFWHHAKLHGLIVQHPLLHHWFWETSSGFLSRFETYWQDKLEPHSNGPLLQFWNQFVGREQHFKTLTEFLESDEHTALAVIAEGGMGKTRLCIEFFKRLVETQEEWLPLVLMHEGFNLKEFQWLLSSKKRLLILIDDAHEVEPGILRETKRLIDASKGRAKLLLTARSAMREHTLDKFASHDLLLKELPLQRLTLSETKTVFRHELPDLDDNQWTRLAEQSTGIPFIILAYCLTIRKHGNDYRVAEAEGFADFLRKMLRQTENDLAAKSYASIGQVRSAIRVLCLINPFLDTSEGLRVLSDLLELSLEQTDLLTKHLRKSGLLLGKYEVSFRPDPYRDFILSENIKDSVVWLKTTFDKIGSAKQARRIIQNLGQVRLSEEAINGVESFVVVWVDNIKNPDCSRSDFEETVHIIRLTVSMFPEVGLTAIRNILEVYENPDSSLHHQRGLFDTKPVFDNHWRDIELIFESIFFYFTVPDQWKAGLEVLERYCRIRNGFHAIKSSFGFRLEDFSWEKYVPKTTCGRQVFLKDVVLEYLQSGDWWFEEFAMYACDALLTSVSHHFWTQRIPDRPEVKNIHQDIIPALIHFFYTTQYPDHRECALEHLVARFNYSVRQHKEDGQPDYDWSEDVNAIGPFLENLLDDKLTVNERNLFLEHQWIREPVKPKYAELVERIIGKSWQKTNRRDDLHLLILHSHGTTGKAYLLDRIHPIIENYGSDRVAFAVDLIHIGKEIKARTPQTVDFLEALNVIADNFPDIAKAVADYISVNEPGMNSEKALLLRGNRADEKYFYREVDAIWQSGTPADRTTAVWLLTAGRKRDASLYRERDFNYFEVVIEERNEEAVQDILYGLSGYAWVNRERAFSLIARILEDFDFERYGGLFTDVFAMENEAYQDTFRDDIRQLIDKHTDKLSLKEHDMKLALHWLERTFGFDALFNYLQQRYAKYRSRQIEEWTKPQPLNRNDYDRSYRIETFRKALEWYVSEPDDERTAQKDIANYFQFNPNNSEDLVREIFYPVACICRGSAEKLEKIAGIIQKWGIWEEPIARLLVQLADWRLEIPSSNWEDARDILGIELLRGLGYTRSGGEGIPRHLIAWRELLYKFKEEGHPRSEILELLTNAASHSDEFFRQHFEAEEKWEDY